MIQAGDIWFFHVAVAGVSAVLLAGCPGEKRCEKRCEDAADAELAKSEVIQTGHICFFQLAVCFWVSGLPLFFKPRFPPNNFSQFATPQVLKSW